MCSRTRRWRRRCSPRSGSWLVAAGRAAVAPGGGGGGLRCCWPMPRCFAPTARSGTVPLAFLLFGLGEARGRWTRAGAMLVAIVAVMLLSPVLNQQVLGARPAASSARCRSTISPVSRIMPGPARRRCCPRPFGARSSGGGATSPSSGTRSATRAVAASRARSPTRTHRDRRCSSPGSRRGAPSVRLCGASARPLEFDDAVDRACALGRSPPPESESEPNALASTRRARPAPRRSNGAGGSRPDRWVCRRCGSLPRSARWRRRGGATPGGAGSRLRSPPRRWRSRRASWSSASPLTCAITSGRCSRPRSPGCFSPSAGLPRRWLYADARRAGARRPAHWRRG